MIAPDRSPMSVVRRDTQDLVREPKFGNPNNSVDTKAANDNQLLVGKQ